MLVAGNLLCIITKKGKHLNMYFTLTINDYKISKQFGQHLFFYSDKNYPNFHLQFCKQQGPRLHCGKKQTRPVLDRFHDSSKVNALC